MAIRCIFAHLFQGHPQYRLNRRLYTFTSTQTRLTLHGAQCAVLMPGI